MHRSTLPSTRSSVTPADFKQPDTHLPAFVQTVAACARPNERSVYATKPHCEHPSGSWCTCKKFVSKSQQPVLCRICEKPIQHPNYTPKPHDAHGVCIIFEKHDIGGAG